MDKYIKELLTEFSKIILPGFGAIVLEDEETGELMFNEYLTYNDGKLDAKIAAESNLEPQQVKNTIAKYVRDIQNQLDKGETYDIFGLGFFTKNKDGGVDFKGNLKTGIVENTDFEGPSPTPQTSKEEIQKESAEKLDTTEKSDSSPKTNQNKLSESNDQETKEPNQQHSSNDENDKKNKTKADSKTNQAPGTAGKNAIKKEEEKKKKRLSPIFWIIIILLIISAGGFTFIALNYEKVKTYMGWNEFEVEDDSKNTLEMEQPLITHSADQQPTDSETTSSSEDNVEADTLDNETALEEQLTEETITQEEKTANKKQEIAKEAKSDQTQKPAVKTGSYHLIAGSFSVYGNAEQLVKTLKGKGLDAKIIGKIGALHFVSAQSYNSLDQAKKDLSNVRSKAPGAWIYKY